MDLTLSVNHACNLRCTYCYAGDKFQRAMPFEVALKAVERAFAEPGPLVRILFFGGEPLLEPKLIDAVATAAEARAEASGKRVRFGLTTNGTLLDEERLELMLKHNIQVTFSLDGDQQAHDSARVFADGGGSWETVVERLRASAERLGRVQTISVVHPGNVDRLADSFDAVAALGSRRMSFNIDYDSAWDDALLDRYEAALERLTDRAIEHYRAGNDFSVQPLHGKIISRLKGGLSTRDRCDFGCNEWAVAPSGRIYPCDRLIGADGPENDDVIIGTVDAGVDRVRVHALKDPKDTADVDCTECAFIDRCSWWCGCVNRALTGHVDQISGVLCRVEQIGIAAADRLATTLFAEGNRPFLGRYYLAALPHVAPGE